MRAASDELLTTANGWHGMTAQLISTAAPSSMGVSGQPSAAAVNAVHAGVAAAGEAFAARTQITAVKTAAASFAYTNTDSSAADLLNAVIESL